MRTSLATSIDRDFSFMKQDATINYLSPKSAAIRTMLRNAWITGGLSIGLKDVWREANKHRGWLLINSNICTTTNAAIEDVIQQVLENGGAVELVEGDELKDYGHIVLIRY